MDSENDEEYTRVESLKELRAKKLGFKPQSELFCNFYLPYASDEAVLDKESHENIEYIKQNLGTCVAYREVYPSMLFISKLMNYIKLYGYKFSKDDHIQFIKLLLKLIQIKNLDPSKLNKCCSCLILLLRKSHLLSPEDLEIDWRQLYELCKIYIDKRSSKGDLIRSYPTLDQVIMQTVRFSSYYFPKSANQEIIDELLPQVLPLDIGKVDSAMELLCLFINSSHYEGWFDYLMGVWNIYHYPSWNVDIMNTMAATASQNIGYINWTPHIPMMFTRILRSLELPVSYKQIKSSRNQSLSMDACATWIISVICPQYDTNCLTI